jgi:ferredoxin
VADRADAWPDNVGGSVDLGGRRLWFFVDRQCIYCAVCSDAAPRNFRASDDEDHDICFQQPRDLTELAQCEEAMASCPVEAIGCTPADAAE